MACSVCLASIASACARLHIVVKRHVFDCHSLHMCYLAYVLAHTNFLLRLSGILRRTAQRMNPQQQGQPHCWNKGPVSKCLQNNKNGRQKHTPSQEAQNCDGSITSSTLSPACCQLCLSFCEHLLAGPSLELGAPNRSLCCACQSSVPTSAENNSVETRSSSAPIFARLGSTSLPSSVLQTLSCFVLRRPCMLPGQFSCSYRIK